MGMSTRLLVIVGPHTMVSFTEVVPAPCWSYFSWETKSHFFPPCFLMAATHITVTQAAARGSRDTRAPYQQQWVKNSKLAEDSKLALAL